MNNTENTKKFTIRMQRNQIAEVDSEVEATNDMEAIDKAMELAENETDASGFALDWDCLLYTSPSPRDLSTSRMPSSA